MGCGASREPAGPAPGAAQFTTSQTAAPSSSAVKSKAAQGAPAAGTDNQSGKVTAKAPPPSFAKLIATGTVVPDEREGPYALGSYHANVTGGHRGYKAKEGRDEWEATNKAIMALQTSWATIDFEAENAVDPEYMFSFGAINGRGLAMHELRPTVIKAQAAMKEGYGGAFESARGKAGAGEVYARIEALPEKIGKVRQPGGEQLDLIGLYKGALGAVGELWEYGQQVIVASGEAGVAASWGLKKALRIWFKLATKYGGDVSKVTDCARISLEFATAEGLERAATFVLQAASTFKNRVANPTDEGYRDLMFTVLIGGHVCEVQLHLVEMIKAKKSGAGHKMYKVCRRVLNGPIVAEDTYCLEVVGKELRGEGERNAKGEKEGRGTLVYDDGDMYEGQWLAGKKHGQGKWTSATGDVYEGAHVEGKKHGHGTYTFAGGNVYDGEWADSKKHGRGKETFATGDVYEGEHVKGKRQGRGTETYASGNSYDGEWADDTKNGIGTYTWDDGDVYEGEWKKGKLHGRGKITEANGNSYDGEHANGKKHGSGTYTYANGNLYKGEYVQDKKHGRGKMAYADGKSYDGEWADGKKHGSGTYTYANGNLYKGEYVQDKKHGRGKMAYADGKSYDGEWADGKKHGSGTFTHANGRVEVGCYEADADVGQGVKWSADRTEAWELQAGKQVRGIPLDEAAKIAERVGLPVPP